VTRRNDFANDPRRVSAAGLSIRDISEVVREIVRKQKGELVEHMERRIKILKLQRPRDERVDALHRRMTVLESAVRRLTRDRV
jgi:hypothetical protein